jgi:hypothetical protein
VEILGLSSAITQNKMAIFFLIMLEFQEIVSYLGIMK